MEFISSPKVNEGHPNLLPIRITVLRAHSLPRFKTLLWKERKFYATVTYGESTWRTRSVRSAGQSVEWNQSIDAFDVQPLSRIAICLYVERTPKKDFLVGRQEIDCVPQCELGVVLSSADGNTIQTTEPITLSLTLTMSANANSSPTVAVNNPNSATVNLENSVAEGDSAHQPVQYSSETMQLTTVTAPLSPSSRADLPVGGSTPVGPVADSHTEMSRTLDSAEEAVDAMKTWKSAVDVVKQVMDHVGPIVKLLPHAKLAWELLSKIPETLIRQFRRDDNVRALLEAIRDAFEIAKEAEVLKDMEPASTQAKILDEMLECVSECSKFIISYAKDVEVGTRVLKNVVGQVDEKVERYRTNLGRLRENFLAHVAVLTRVAVLEAELDAKIRELPHKGGWRFGDEKRCLPGTREDFLDHIMKWVENPKSKRGLVLLGQAGTGKSSIAHEIARYFDDKCLGSYFTFLRKEGSKDDAYQLFTTLARDLSDRQSTFKLALGKIIKDNSSLRGSRDYRTLFQRLLIEPLRNLPLPDPILVVIDALDESGDAIGKIGLHSFLAHHLVDLPSNFRVFVTSRPEDGVEPVFSKASSVDILYMNDAKLASKTEQDIGLYIQKELPPDVFKDHGVKLAKASEGLFQWATVTCGFINSRASLGLTMNKRVQRILGHSRGRSGGLLDSLYEEVLKEYFKNDEAQALFRSIMGQLFAAIEPLSIESLIVLRRHAPVDDPEDSDPVPVLEILGHLGSLLSNVTSSDQTRPIIPLHTSFRDFLTNRTNNVFYVDLQDAHHRLTHSCLGLMLNDLKFNICQLESSYLANSDVPDIDSRISKYISSGLSYACVFWGNHLEHVAFEHDLFAELKSLFETKFLFLLEVLSLTSRVRLALPALSSLLKWLQPKHSQTEVKDLLALLHDAFAFVRHFGMAVVKSAPHIYISALPFGPRSSHILNQYLPQFPHTLSLERGKLPYWPALEMTIEGHDDPVVSVVFSPDGQRIASASWDCTIRVWDAATGELVAGPFIGHTNLVNFIAFSPDGQRIASASDDDSIRIWDAATGALVKVLFTGKTSGHPVKSFAFSLDGQRITSTSADHTICVWDAATGEVIAGPFTTRTNSPFFGSFFGAFSPGGERIACASDDYMIQVLDATTGEVVAGPFNSPTSLDRCIAFSPDGRHIASASMDSAIRVLDAATGEVVAGPFTGHNDIVCSVAFSPDGQRIASGSSDCMICVWDAATGEVVAGPFIGHTLPVNSVVFSPDGQRIASASADKTIRVWDAKVVAGPFNGHRHINWVNSVAFSPDGQYIASASDDYFIHLWDAATGEIAASPFTEHTLPVNSIAFSPDGQRIASASWDRTIRVWNAATGVVVAGPFTGHTDVVNSVAFSPDGQHIASASHDHTIRVWDATTGEIAAGPFTGHTSSVESVAFSSDGLHIASASTDGTIRVWDATGEIAASPFTGHTDCVAFSPDGQRIASASWDHTIRVWDAATGETTVGPLTGHTDLVKCVAFSPDGQHIASASRDRTIRMWDAATGEVIAGPFTGHTSEVTSLAFSPDGQHIVSASSDGAIRMEKVVTEDIENIHFMDHSRSWLNSDGWICGKGGELLLWIPALRRACLHRSSTIWTAGQQETRLDFSKFVHGSNWATVYDNRLSK